MFKNKRLLYLVKHAEKPIFKIGIASDKRRFKQLDSDYSIDWEKSFYFEGENQHVIKMEKILHRLFFEQQQKLEEGTGRTEWFSTNCLDQTIEAIQFNVKNSKFNIGIKSKAIDLTEDTDLSFEFDDQEIDLIWMSAGDKSTFGTIGMIYNFHKMSLSTRRRLRKVLPLIRQGDNDKLCLETVNEFGNMGVFLLSDGSVQPIICDAGMYGEPNEIIGFDKNIEADSNTQFIIDNLMSMVDCSVVILNSIDIKCLEIDLGLLYQFGYEYFSRDSGDSFIKTEYCIYDTEQNKKMFKKMRNNKCTLL